MMRIKLLTCSAFLLGGLLASCASPPTTTSQTQADPAAITSGQAIVDALAAVQPSGGIPAHFRTEDVGDAVRAPDDFDVNAYFDVLTHLSVEPGYTVDYLYSMKGLGGSPFIYARPSSRAPYASLDEYVAATADEYQDTTARRVYGNEYLSHVKIDDAREGYFQSVALEIMDDQFYQYWHAGYNDTTLVCDKEALERTMAAAGSAFQSKGLPANVQNQARKIDLTPRVEFPDDSTAIVRVVTFSKWGGFKETKYTMSRRFPHTTLAQATTTLVEYDCGVQF
jgi:hypothetical protein